MNNLPDLPSPYFWRQESTSENKYSLKAKNTVWARNNGTVSEPIGIIKKKDEQPHYYLWIWKTNPKGTGDWQELPAPCATLEEAANLLWTLCQLGEIDHSFPEESDETK